MKKFVAVLAVALVSAAAFAGGAKEESSKASAEPIVLKWGSVHAPTTITTQMMMRVVEEVNAKCEGRVELQAYPNGALGGSRDLVEGVQLGIVDMVTDGPAQFSSWIPKVTIAEAPYIWRDVNHMNNALNGKFGDELNKEFATIGVKIMGAFYYGTRQLTTSKAAINSVSDMKGLKIRVPEVDTYLAMINSWGAKPTPLSFNELYLALQQNVVDGQENPLTTFDGSKFYEVQKYVVLTNHIICPNMIFGNLAKLNKLSEKDAKILDEAVKAGVAWNNEQVQKAEKELVESLKQKGVTVIQPDVESFRAVTAPAVSSQFESKWGKGTWESIQAIK